MSRHKVSFQATPVAFARHLASYIKDPSKIEALTLREFTRCPPRADIQQMIRAHNVVKPPIWENKTIARDGDENDGEDFSVRGLVTIKKPKDLHKPLPIKEVREAVLSAVATAVADKGGHYLTGEVLLDLVARDFCLMRQEVQGAARSAVNTEARAVVARILREQGWSYLQIGKLLCKDHSSISYLIGKWDAYVARNPEVASIYAKRAI